MEVDRSVRVSPKDVFLHLLAIITLYASSVSFIALIFQYINLAFPNPLQNTDFYYTQGIYHSIRLAISVLIVVFPAFLITNLFLGKAYTVTPEKRNLTIRKWLIYFTLFVAALIAIGDFVTLVYRLLEGDFALAFILKVLTVFFVAGSVFFYYFSDIRKYKIE